jgi:preprotein translocase subunit SecB
MSENQNNNINISTILLEELEFKRKPNVPDYLIDASKFDAGKLDFATSIERAFSEKGDALILRVRIAITEKDVAEPTFNLVCKMVGIFSQEESGSISLEKFAEYNAPAIIIPYMREVISSISTKAGIIPIIIPPLNLIKMINEAKTIPGDDKKLMQDKK